MPCFHICSDHTLTQLQDRIRELESTVDDLKKRLTGDGVSSVMYTELIDWKVRKFLQSISANFSLYKTFRTSLRRSEGRCEVQKFISEFASQFVNKGCDWPLNSKKPIKCLVYKPACEF